MSISEQVTVGQEVAVSHSTSYGMQYQAGYTVTKVTPAGQIVISRTVKTETKTEVQERRFNKYGSEMGVTTGRFESGYNLELDVEKVRKELATRKARIAAVSAMSKAMKRLDGCGSQESKDSLIARISEVEALMIEARAAADAM